MNWTTWRVGFRSIERRLGKGIWGSNVGIKWAITIAISNSNGKLDKCPTWDFIRSVYKEFVTTKRESGIKIL